MKKSQADENMIIKNIIYNHKYNLYQQFLVVGIDPKIMYNINDYDITSLQEPYSTPKIISKYPNMNLPYLNIPDIIVSSHCFPQGIINSIVEYNENDLITKEKKTECFMFSLENMNPEEKANSLRTNKVYYICLLFYENIENYRNCINLRKNTSNIDIFVKNKGLLIPKVICLSSFTPFYEQTKYILQKIRNYVNNFNFNNKSMDNLNVLPIEKVIEGIIFNLPALPRGNFSIKLNTDIFSYKSNFNFEDSKLPPNENDIKHIIFEETPPNQNPRKMINYSLLMNYFRIDEIFEIIKYIILEEPILFFSEDKEALSNIIEGLISLIYPLEYPHPVISILPEQYYSLISLFKHFIIGINYKYSEEILNKKFIFDGVKFIRIIRLEKRFNNILNFDENDILGYSVFTSIKADENKPLIKFDQIEENVIENDLKDSKLINDKKKINLPRHYFEKCCRKIEKSTTEKVKEIESNNKLKNKNIVNKLIVEAFNNEIRDDFLYFFVCILLKYQEYCIKYEKKIYECQDKNGNMIEKEFDERSLKLDEKYYMGKIKLVDIFSTEEFINSTPSLDRPFYRVFFETKIFFNFILKKIFPDSNQDKLDILFFDEIINKKLSRELYVQKKETKFLDFDFVNLKQELEVKTLNENINNNIAQYLQKRDSRVKALNYFQYIYLDGEKDDTNVNNPKKGNLYFYYFVFPILLNDGIFYNEKYKNQYNNQSNDSNYYIWSYLEYSEVPKQNHRLFYNIFNNESIFILDDEEISKNYKLYDYSLNPTSSFRFQNDYLIKILWLIYFSKVFKSISFSKKKYFFEIIMNFLQKNIDIIDNKTLDILFNSFIRNGDRDMNQIFFPYMKNKTYTSYLCVREKMKSESNFMRYIISLKNEMDDSSNNKENENANSNKGEENKYENKKLLYFKINSFCNNKPGNSNSICGEPFSGNIFELIGEERYITFKCRKCHKEQKLIISCKYNFDEKEEKSQKYDINYAVNFEILTPLALLQQEWFKNNTDLDLNLICENHLQCYLSTIFYFYQQNLPCDFLLPKSKVKKELSEIKNNYYSIVNNEEFFDEEKIKKIVVKNSEKKDKKEDKENFVLEINGKTTEEIDIDNTDKMMKARESMIKKGLKSSFKKRERDSKKKSVEFKLDLKNSDSVGDA